MSRLPAVSSLLCRNLSRSEPRLMISAMVLCFHRYDAAGKGGMLQTITRLNSDRPENPLNRESNRHFRQVCFGAKHVFERLAERDIEIGHSCGPPEIGKAGDAVTGVGKAEG